MEEIKLSMIKEYTSKREDIEKYLDMVKNNILCDFSILMDNKSVSIISKKYIKLNIDQIKVIENLMLNINCEFNKTIEKLRELEKIENKICEIKYKDIMDIFNEIYGGEPSNTLLCTKEYNMFKDKLKELFEINSEK